MVLIMLLGSINKHQSLRVNVTNVGGTQQRDVSVASMMKVDNFTVTLGRSKLLNATESMNLKKKILIHPHVLPRNYLSHKLTFLE